MLHCFAIRSSNCGAMAGSEEEIMYKICRTEQSARRQQEMEEGLLTMMLEKPYDAITVSDLCNRLDLPRKSFYRYFGSKEDALVGLLDRRLMDYETSNTHGTAMQSRGVTLDLNWFFTFWQAQKDLLDALECSGLSGILVQRAIHNSRRAEIFACAPSGMSRAEMEMSTAFIVSGLMSIVLQWHHEGYRESPGAMAETAYRMLNRPLVPNLK